MNLRKHDTFVMYYQLENLSVILILQCILADKENLCILDTYIYKHSESYVL